MSGSQIRHNVYAGSRLVALISFGASAWRLADRDWLIAWNTEQRLRNLHRIVNNARFPILPWASLSAKKRTPDQFSISNGRKVSSLSILEQIGVRPRAYEDDGITLEPVDQQEITANVAFAMVSPVAFEWMVQPFGTQRRIVGNEQQYGHFQPIHVVPAGAGKTFPVFAKPLRVVARPGQRRPLTAGWLFRGHRAARRLCQNGRPPTWPSCVRLPSLRGFGRWEL